MHFSKGKRIGQGGNSLTQFINRYFFVSCTHKKIPVDELS
jgi:hypothetical protein